MQRAGKRHVNVKTIWLNSGINEPLHMTLPGLLTGTRNAGAATDGRMGPRYLADLESSHDHLRISSFEEAAGSEQDSVRILVKDLLKEWQRLWQWMISHNVCQTAQDMLNAIAFLHLHRGPAVFTCMIEQTI